MTRSHISLRTWVTVALSSSKIPAEGKSLAPGPQDDNKNTCQASFLCGLTAEVFKNNTLFRIKHLRPPSPKILVAELSQTDSIYQFVRRDWTSTS